MPRWIAPTMLGLIACLLAAMYVYNDICQSMGGVPVTGFFKPECVEPVDYESRSRSLLPEK